MDTSLQPPTDSRERTRGASCRGVEATQRRQCPPEPIRRHSISFDLVNGLLKEPQSKLHASNIRSFGLQSDVNRELASAVVNYSTPDREAHVQAHLESHTRFVHSFTAVVELPGRPFPNMDGDATSVPSSQPNPERDVLRGDCDGPELGKKLAIKSACAQSDIPSLKALAESEGGFLTDDLRRRACSYS